MPPSSHSVYTPPPPHPHASSATQQPSLSPRFRHHPPAHLCHPLPRLPPLVYATLPPIFPHTFIHYSPQHILLSRQASKLSSHEQHGHPVDCCRRKARRISFQSEGPFSARFEGRQGQGLDCGHGESSGRRVYSIHVRVKLNIHRP